MDLDRGPFDEYVEPSYAFAPDELVVDAPYADLVKRRIAELRPTVTATSFTNDTLRLTRLSLSGVEDYARGNARPDSAAEPIRTLVTNLRAWFSHQSGGWVPALEGNRRAHGVIGLPQPKIQAEGKLAIADAGQWQHSLDRNAGKNVKVGVLDTAIYEHNALTGHIVATSLNLLEPTREPISPAAGHATFIAGLITAQAPGAEIIARKVLDNTGHAYVWEAAEAMITFADDNIDVLNVSLGCHTKDGAPCPLPLQRAVEVLSNRTIIVAAAGNHGGLTYRKLPTWPAALPGVLAVGAAKDHELDPDHEPTLAPFTPRLPWVDCIAPGYDLVSTYPFDGFARWSGTSFAAAMVTGAIAKRMVAGEITAKGALRLLLETPNPVVRKYVWEPESEACETISS
jgi:membrane-anchored mycosin MYCP